jgi:hypothetical protein
VLWFIWGKEEMGDKRVRGVEKNGARDEGTGKGMGQEGSRRGRRRL